MAVPAPAPAAPITVPFFWAFLRSMKQDRSASRSRGAARATRARSFELRVVAASTGWAATVTASRPTMR